MNGPLTLPDFYKPFHHGELASTNDEALGLAVAGAPEGTLVTADCQSAGRGRRGRDWESPLGNLYLSVVLKPKHMDDGIGAVGFAASLAIADAIRPHMPEGAEITLKWPNDVLVNGAKIAGLLIEVETSLSARGRQETGEGALVLGVGINLVSHPLETPYPATSVLAEAGTAVAPGRILHGFALAFLDHYQNWQKAGLAPLRAAWLEQARGVGEPITIRVDTRRFDGIFADLDETGALVLDLGGGVVKKITAGDVFFPDAD